MGTTDDDDAGLWGAARRVLGLRLLLALAVVVDVRLRWAHVQALRETPLFTHLIGDSAHYDAWAKAIAAGDWLSGTRPFYMDPLYPYFLATLYRLFGPDLELLRWVQVGLSGATCLLVGVLARRLSGPAAGTVAAFCWAFYRPDVFNTGEVDKTALGVFLTAAALALMVGEKKAERAAAGALFGLAALTRGNLLAAAPVVALLYLWPDRRLLRQPQQLARTHGAASAALFLAAFFAAVAPATARNKAVSGQWVLTTSGAGPTFFTGNSPWSHTGYFELLPFVRPEARHEETDFGLEAERRAGRPLTAQEVSSFWLRQGLRFCAEHPALTLWRYLRKLWLIGNDFEASDMIDAQALGRYSPALRLPLFTPGWFFPLALFGAWAWRKHPRARVVALWAGALAAALAAFFILARYRAYLMPAVVALSVLGAESLARAAREKEWRRVLAGAAAVAALSVASFWPPKVAKVAGALGPLNISAVFSAVGNFDEARALLLQASRAAPEEPGPWCGLGELEAHHQLWSQAREHARRCLEADANHRGAWLLMGRVEEAQGNFAAAAEAYRRQLALIPGEEQAALRLEALEDRL